MLTVPVDTFPLQSLVTKFGIKCSVDIVNFGVGAYFKLAVKHIVLSRGSTPYVWFHEVGHVLDAYVNLSNIAVEADVANDIYYNAWRNDFWFDDYCQVPCETVANQVAKFLCNRFNLSMTNDEVRASSYPVTEESKRRIDCIINYITPQLPDSVTAFNRAEHLVRI